MQRIVKNGSGWRLGWDANAPEFKALVGGDDWAIELTEAEFTDFCRLLEQLAATITDIARELMDEEKIVCEVESDLIWLEAEGYHYAYNLHLIVNSGRRVEVSWPASVVPKLISEIFLLKVF